jgi:catechol 2,3-dioxygenase-like lactoylglutathione lyase family enzyme
MVYRGTLICVADMARARAFYEDLLGQTVQFDFGENVGYKSGLALHLRSHFAGLIDGAEIRPEGRDGELYFEHDELPPLARELERRGVRLVHPLREQPWRQLVVRFYDPDGHIVEVGEDLGALARRLRAGGLDEAGIVQATGMPADYVRSLLELVPAASA